MADSDYLNVIMDFIAGDGRYYKLTGDPGSGKTQFILRVAERIAADLVICAPTNRAVKELGRRGVDASTIHSLSFAVRGTGQFRTKFTPILDVHLKPLRDAAGKIVMGEETEEICSYDFDAAILYARASKRTTLTGRPLVIIVDEASMVPAPIWYALIMKSDVRLILVGDANQLQPVESELQELKKRLEDNVATAAERAQFEEWAPYERFFHRSPADLTLTGNHRQRTGSSIIPLAAEALRTGRVPVGTHGDVSVLSGLDVRQQGATLAAQDLVIAYRNNTVALLNAIIRNVRHKAAFATISPADRALPRVGDRLYVTARHDVFSKGDLLTIVSDPEFDRITGIAVADVHDDEGALVRGVTLSLNAFGYRTRHGVAAVKCVYGFALTCHKCQGSQADRVLVVDDGYYERHNWLYTALSRAAQSLTVFINPLGVR